MFLRFLILLFLWISNFVFANIENEIQPYFKDFFLGQSIAQVEKNLLNYQTTLALEKERNFKLDIPLFIYLSEIAKQYKWNIDTEKERIYIDDIHFFDLKDQRISNSKIDFFYEQGFYYMVLKEIKNFPVQYPTRVNPHLEYLRFKFFQGILYAIEYQAVLKPYQINRLREKYRKLYGVLLDKPSNRFETKQGVYFIDIHPQKGLFKVILMEKNSYKKIEQHIQQQIYFVIEQLFQHIQTQLHLSSDIKKLLLQERKKVLQEKIKKAFESVDDL